MFSYKLDSNLRLELPDPKDAKEATEVVRRNLSHLKPWMPWAVDEYSEDHARDWIRRTRETFASDGSFNALIILNDRIIGSIGFHDFDRRNRHASIGYWIDKEEEGKGIITLACKVFIDYAFKELDINRIEIRCSSKNFRSAAVPERLGFKKEGLLRQAELLPDGFHDLNIYALLAEDPRLW